LDGLKIMARYWLIDVIVSSERTTTELDTSEGRGSVTLDLNLILNRRGFTVQGTTFAPSPDSLPGAAPAREVKCGNCRFFQPGGDEFGECRRHTPRTLVSNPGSRYPTGSYFPEIEENKWCGEFSLKPREGEI
jgi:hypothetical protein